MGLSDWIKQYGIVDPAGKEIISFPLWEKQSYVSGTTTNLTYFAANQTGANGNLPLSGQLPAGWFFIVQAIRVLMMPSPTTDSLAASADAVFAGPLNDVNNLLIFSSAKMTVGSKEYGRWPTAMLPGGGGAYGLMAASGTFAAGTNEHVSHGLNGIPDPRVVYSLPVPFMIPPQYDFRFSIDWSAAQTLQAGNTVIYAILDGTLIRPKQ